jgi:outer membrane protein assembly factor BamA
MGPTIVFSQKATIEEVIIEGNKRTFQNTIRRELPAKIGDTIIISQQKDFLETQRFMLMNSGVFSDVLCELLPLNKDSSKYRLRVYVEEAWPIFVIPYLELVDRNFNLGKRI